MTKQEVIDALLGELTRISAQTKGYDEFSTMGCLHIIAHGAVAKYAKHGSADIDAGVKGAYRYAKKIGAQVAEEKTKDQKPV
jgi:hypothetical protein